MITFCPLCLQFTCVKRCLFFSWNICQALCFVCFCVCTCTNQLVLSTEVTRLNFLNSIVMGQINQCGFQSHVAIDRYCIFLEINTFELSWVEYSYYHGYWWPGSLCHQVISKCVIALIFPNIPALAQKELTHWGQDKNSPHFTDYILKCIFLNENVWISIKISLKFDPKWFR